MKKRNISLITGLMAFALLGVMAMQFYFLRQSYNLQLKAFDSEVNQALNNVISKIATQDANKFLIDKSNQLRFTRQADTVEHTTYLKITHSTQVVGRKKVITRIVQDSGKTARNRRIAQLKDSAQHLMMENVMDEVRSRFNLQVNVEEYTDEFGNVRQNFTPQIITRGIDPQEQRAILNSKQKKFIDTIHKVYIDPLYGSQVISIPRLNPLWVQQQALLKQQQIHRK